MKQTPLKVTMTKINNALKINGIFLLNKPQGLTSNTALQKVKRIFNASKAGHTGSLDPLATGMLPICFGEATKYSQYLLDANKCYEATGTLGIKTNTADSLGEITERTEGPLDITKDALEDTLKQFTGDIKQIPSMFSALKHQGRPLYKLARAGIEIERKARDITIYNLVLNHFDGENFAITVTCSKGTYIRNLVEDIGDVLGVGAHVSRLHRKFTAGFDNDVMYSLEEIESFTPDERNKLLLPLDRSITSVQKILLSDDDIRELRHGRAFEYSNIENYIQVGIVRVYDSNNLFVGLADFSIDGTLKAKRLMST